MNTKQKIAELEKKVAEVNAQMNQPIPCPPDAAVGQMGMCKEDAPRRPSKAERRSKLVAAHVALAAVRHVLGDYSDWEAINRTQQAIAASIGRLELTD